MKASQTLALPHRLRRIGLKLTPRIEIEHGHLDLQSLLELHSLQKNGAQ